MKMSWDGLAAHVAALERLRDEIKVGSRGLKPGPVREFQVRRFVEFWNRNSHEYEGRKVRATEQLAYDAAALLALRHVPPIAFNPEQNKLGIVVVRVVLECSAKDASLVSQAVNKVYLEADPIRSLRALGGVNGAWRHKPGTPIPSPG